MVSHLGSWHRIKPGWFHWRLLVAVALALVPALGCGSATSESAKPANAKPAIVASVFPIANLIEQIVGDAAEVKAFMPPGANPHGFEPGAAQVALVAKADVLIPVGLNFDLWLERSATASGRRDLKPLRMADLLGIKADPHADHHHSHAGHGHQHGPECSGPNPHLWLDPVLTIQFVEKITPRLAAMVPADQQEGVLQRSAKLVAELKQIDDEYRTQLGAVPVKNLITFHNAFDLPAERYGLKVVAHLADLVAAPRGDVTVAQMTSVITAARKHNLKVIYAEPQFPRQAIETIQREAGLKLLILDPEGDPISGHYRTYQDMMRKNLQTLVEGQSIVAG